MSLLQQFDVLHTNNEVDMEFSN